MLDIRIPIGFMFSLLGILLTIYGIVTISRPEMYEISLGININLWWGLLMLGFGIVMLAVSKKPKKKEIEEVKEEIKEDIKEEI